MVKNNWGFIYSSAKEQHNIDAIFDKVIELVVANDQLKQHLKEKKLQEDIQLMRELSRPSKGKKCC
jgi:hypothetical protein